MRSSAISTSIGFLPNLCSCLLNLHLVSFIAQFHDFPAATDARSDPILKGKEMTDFNVLCIGAWKSNPHFKNSQRNLDTSNIK